MRIFFAFLFIVSILFSCESYIDDAPFKKLTIKKGRHSSVTKRNNLEYPFLSFDIFFDKTAEYATKDPKNQMDINKLFGFSDCNASHLENSIRFGWNWNDGKIAIYGYQHLEGNTIWKYIGSVEPFDVHRYSIYLFEDLYLLEIDGVTTRPVKFNRSNTICEIGFYYQLFPYFGGDEPAPHDINIYMKKVFNERSRSLPPL